jgi:succinoglycan biosynthesis transport protein ExoP
MRADNPNDRLLRGHYEPPLRPVELDETAGVISFRQALAVVRRRFQLILAVTVVGAALGLFLASREPTTYKASAMLRLAGERQTITGTEENANLRTADPMLSVMELLRSRTVLGVVVDSLGLQLVSLTPEFSVEDLTGVRIDPRAVGDSVQVMFRSDGVSARRGERAVTAAYGQTVNLGIVQFMVRSRPAIENVTLGIRSRESAIDALLAYLAVTPREGTDVFDVAYVAEDARAAQRVVNSTIHAFQTLNVQWARERSRRRAEFLTTQLASNDSVLNKAQGELAAFLSRKQSASTKDLAMSRQDLIFRLESERDQMAADRETFLDLQQRLKGTDDGSREDALRALATSPAMGDNPAIGGLYQQLLKYQLRIDSMTTGPWKASASNPDLIQAKALARGTQDQLIQAVRSHVGAIDARMKAIDSQLRRQGASIASLPADAEEEMRLERRVNAFANMGDELRAELQKARMAEAVEAGDIEIVALAPLPSTPLLNMAVLKVSLGLFLGLALGIVIAYILEALNTAVRRPEDLEAVLHVPGLAVIPRITDGSRNAQSHFRRLLGSGKASHQNVGSPLTGNQTFSIGIEAFRNLRTGLIWSDGGEALRTLVVTSAAPGEGKTMTAANLAVTLAYDGLRVLLVDCDIRRPRVHGLFQLPRAPGLMELLRASSDPDAPQPRAIRETPVARLSVLTCGALPVNAANLLSGTRMRVLLRELQEQFDIIVLDTPPVLATADASIVASLTDGVLLVVRAGTTDKNAAQRAYQQLANVGARVVGTVLNDPGGEVAKEGDYYYPYDYAAQE